MSLQKRSKKIRLESTLSSEVLLREYVRQSLANEGILSSIGHVTLDLVGLIPGVGEAADAANAAWYATEGEYFLAALSLVSLVPVVGDIVGKGGKLAMWATKLGSKGAKAAKTAADAGSAAVKAAKVIKKHRGTIKKVFDRARDNDKLKGYVDKMTQALSDWVKETLGMDSGEAEASA